MHVTQNPLKIGKFDKIKHCHQQNRFSWQNMLQYNEICRPYPPATYIFLYSIRWNKFASWKFCKPLKICVIECKLVLSCITFAGHLTDWLMTRTKIRSLSCVGEYCRGVGRKGVLCENNRWKIYTFRSPFNKVPLSYILNLTLCPLSLPTSMCFRWQMNDERRRRQSDWRRKLFFISHRMDNLNEFGLQNVMNKKEKNLILPRFVFQCLMCFVEIFFSPFCSNKSRVLHFLSIAYTFVTWIFIRTLENSV